MEDKVAVLVNSCDTYTDVLDYFFFFYKKFWKCPYKTYLNMEDVLYKNDIIEKTFTFGKTAWSKRLIKCLKEIKQELIIMFLDDFFLLDNVNQKKLDECVKKMQKDNTIGYFMFEPNFFNQFNLPKEDEYFRKRNKYEDFLCSAQIILWRKSYLLQVLRKKESPWEFEVYGTFRMSHYKEKLYVLNTDAPLVFPYILRGKGAIGVIGGKWQEGNVALFEKYNLKCDFSKRGFIDLEKRYAPKKNIKDKYKELNFFKKLFLPFYNYKLFKAYYKPIIKKYKSLIDIKGRIKNKFSK